jgi:hypothetical protein
MDDIKNNFNIGDIVYLNNLNFNNLPDYAIKYLTTYDSYKISRIKDNGMIDIGCYKTNGNKKTVFYFSSNRFSNDKSNNNNVDFNIDWD